MHTTMSMFEIKIAVLGNVSAGKTTFINALLRDKYGAVSLGRTTACVNYFRLSYRNNNNDDDVDRDKVETAVSSSNASLEGVETSSEGTFFDVEYRTAQSTLQETTSDNATFRESSQVHVKYFDIQMGNDEPLCEMREDTKLVLVDVPGINEAGAGGKYRAYVADKWDTFDCAMVVMDGRQGANTEEQVNLLEFVHTNNTEKKEIPVIILCNKVDVPEDEEQAALTKEVRGEVERIFKAPSRDGALTQILGDADSFVRQIALLPCFPAFVTMSAVFAYIYRTGARMTFEKFQHSFDRNLIEMIGLREVGRSVWHKKNNEEKFRLVYDTATNETFYQEGIEATNFDKVLKILSVAVGGSNTQLQLIRKQIDYAIRSLSPHGNVVAQISSIYKRCQVLGQSTKDLTAAFWKVFSECEGAAFDLFSKSPCDVDALDRPFRQLLEYWKFALTYELKKEAEQAVVAMKKMVHRQIAVILAEEAKTTGKFQEGLADDNSWSSLHPIDWMSICQSLELLSFEKEFCESFGREKMHFEKLAHKWIAVAQEVLPEFGHCLRCPHPAPLDFNHFCKQCLTFVVPAGYCKYCGKNDEESVCGICQADIFHNKMASHPFPAFIASSFKDCSLRLFCPVCDCILTFNRRCYSCDVFYFAPTKSDGPSEIHASDTCIFCNGPKSVDSGWCCTTSECRGNNITWKAYPHSWEELVSLTYREDAFAPKFPGVYNSVVRLSVPRKLEDPKHYGHIAWLYCESMTSLRLKQQSCEAET